VGEGVGSLGGGFGVPQHRVGTVQAGQRQSLPHSFLQAAFE
jgi:hypothetical protein